MSVEDAFSYDYMIGGNTETAEKYYITVHRAWLNRIMPKRKDETGLDWVVVNQSKVLLKN